MADYRDKLAASLSDAVYIVLDIETTGGNPERNGLLEVCALRVHRGEIVDRFTSMVNPKKSIPHIIRKITGISNSDVRDAPPASEVVPKFVEFCGDDILVSHNSLGDVKFLDFYVRKHCRHRLDNFFICTHLLATKLSPDAPDKSLGGLGQYFDIDLPASHRAEADALVNQKLWQVYLEMLVGQEFSTPEDVIRFQGDLYSGLRLGWVRPDPESIWPGAGVVRFFDRQDQLIYLFAAKSCRRAVAQFDNLEGLPKYLQKIALKVGRVTTDRHASYDAALVREGIEFDRSLSQVKFAPYRWHQRSVTGLMLSATSDGGFNLEVGPIKSGVVFFLGPINESEPLEEFYQEIAQFFGGNAYKRRCHLPPGTSSDFLLKVLTRTDSFGNFWLVWQNMGFAGLSSYGHLKRRLKAFGKSNLPSLLARSGVMAHPMHKSGGWLVYAISRGVVVSEHEVRGNLGDWVIANRKDLVESCQKPQVEVTPDSAATVNAVLWATTRRSQVLMMSLDELCRGGKFERRSEGNRRS